VKKVILLAAILLSTSLICGAKLFEPTVVQSTSYIYPDQFSGLTLDQAIHSEKVNDGDTIVVRESITPYYEHLNISKSITLEGGLGLQGSTVIDGAGNGTVVTISAPNVKLIGFTIQNGAAGIIISYADNNILKNNRVISNIFGIGIIVSGNNILINNTLSGNRMSFGVTGMVLDKSVRWLQYFIQDVNVSNTINGRPIYYYVNKNGETIPANAGYVAVVNSTNVTVENANINNNDQGILLAYTTNSTIANSNLSQNPLGIHLVSSDNNEIRNNNVTARDVGLWFRHSDNNTIICNDIKKANPVGWGVFFENSSDNILYRNNFAENDNPLGGGASENYLNNSREGNYWDTYAGADSNGDGIGDTMIPYLGVDYHPLMAPWKINRTLSVTRYSSECCFTTLSNSTLASANWNRDLRRIGFNLTSGTAESINITMPRDWLDGPFEIRLNATQLEPSSFSVNQNSANSYIFLDYAPGTYMVEIIGARVLGYRNGDINGDGFVDIFDAILLAGNFGKSDK